MSDVFHFRFIMYTCAHISHLGKVQKKEERDL